MFFLGLLNEAGKQAISSVVRQGSALYPPAASRLKDPCSNYSSLKGTDKWLLGSILLLVARPVLHDVPSLVRRHTVGTGVSAWGGAFSILLKSTTLGRNCFFAVPRVRSQYAPGEFLKIFNL